MNISDINTSYFIVKYLVLPMAAWGRPHASALSCTSEAEISDQEERMKQREHEGKITPDNKKVYVSFS